MKLNSVVYLTSCSRHEVMNIHPFASASNTIGYREILDSMEAYLVSCTGFDACSLQPTSGASGEYAGLLVIRKYQESIGQGHRNTSHHSEVSARHEPSQRSDVRHEDQVD